jgi:hypothetical protein
MLRGALRRALEGYRWLWRAQRRWRPEAFWLACVQFVARVMADMMRSMRPRSPGSAAMVIAAGIVSVTLGIAMSRDRDTDVQPAQWRHDAGGFAVAFPAPWRSASEDDVIAVAPLGEPVPGSTYRRTAGGLLMPRFVTAQTYALGEIGSIPDATRSLTEGIVGPVESVVRAEIASRGVRVAAYRFEEEGEPLTRAAIVFRGSDADGYVIGLTGRRDDEAIVLAAARQIADSIRFDGEPLMEEDFAFAALLEIPLETLLAARAMEYTHGERRDSALWSLLPVAVPDAATTEECRAAAIPFFAQAPPRISFTSAWKGFEIQVTCRSSVITIRTNFRRFVPLLRQFDSMGTQIYEAMNGRGDNPGGVATAGTAFWIVNGERFELYRDSSQAGRPFVRVRIGS